MKAYRITAMVLLALSAPALLTGCSKRAFWTSLGIVGAAGAGAAAVYYAQGDLEVDIDDDYDHVYETSERVIKSRGYQLKPEDSDADTLKATIPASPDEDERNLTINFDRTDEGKTHVSIRVGVVGDEALSRDILRDIEENL